MEKKTNNKILKEEDMYKYVRQYFIDQGFEVKSEVMNCDVMGVREGFIVMIEMKLTLNLDVILQAIERQKISNEVYIAVPRKAKVMKTKRWYDICHMLKRLEIGLLLVSPQSHPHIDLAIKAQPFCRQKSITAANRKRKAAFSEFKEREGDYNTGGCTRRKIYTAYRQKAIFIASCLFQHNCLSIKQIKDLGADLKKTSGILQDNHYGWFERASRGIYRLTEKGRNELNMDS